MDAFQREEAKRALIQRQTIPIWADFRIAVDSLLASYNATAKGQIHPARKSDGNGESIVISSERGFAADQFHQLVLMINISLQEKKCTISATRERWLHRDGSRISCEGKVTVRFILDADPDTGQVWITSIEGEKHSAFECAESFLLESLST